MSLCCVVAAVDTDVVAAVEEDLVWACGTDLDCAAADTDVSVPEV